MIEWIIDQQLLLSVSLILLIASEHFLTKKISAKLAYALWLLVPLILVGNSIPQQWATLPAEVISRYVVNINPVSKHYDIDWFFLVWVSGACLILTFVSIQYIRLYLSINKEVRNGNSACYYSRLISSPIVFGFLAPKVLLPTNFHQLFSEQQQQLIIEHEKTHIRHCDHLWNAIAVLLLALFWFNPLAWFATRSFRVSQELACDHQVLKSKSKHQKVLYANALLGCSESHSLQPSLFPTMGEKITLLKRLDLLKKPVSTNKILAGTVILIAAALAVNTALAKLQREPAKNIKINEVKFTKRVEPEYPQSAIDNQLEGYVTLKFDLTESGSTENIEIVQSFPQGVFDISAVEALKQWESKNNKGAVRRDLYVQLDFRLYRRDTP